MIYRCILVSDSLTISERALRWAINLFKSLEIELEQNGDKVLWSMKQVDDKPSEFQISCSFEEEPMRVFIGTDFAAQLKGRIGGNILSGSELNQFMELYLGPLVSYLEQAKAEWISTRTEEDLSFGAIKRLGSKKFKVGDKKVRAEGFKFIPSGRTRLALPVVDAEFWIANIGGEDVLILSDVRFSGPITRFYVRIKKMILRGQQK